MKDDDGKPFTTVHDRFEVCCPDCCGRVSGHMRKADAIQAARKHACARVEVYDVMQHHNRNPLVFQRGTGEAP